MKKTKTDLWPKDVGNYLRKETPLLLLRQQAALLSEKTHGILLAEIKTDTVGNKLRHTFYIVAPYLRNYRFGLLSIVHGTPDLYPAYMVTVNTPRKVTNEAELIEELKHTFATRETKRIIKALATGEHQTKQVSGPYGNFGLST